MSTRLHIGNLSTETTRDEIAVAFRQDGREVVRVDLVMSRDPGRSRGFAFVEMATPDHARTALLALDGSEIHGKKMRVSAAHPPKSRFGGFCRVASSPRAVADGEARKTP